MSQNFNSVMSNANRKELGNTGEQLVITHLQKNGFSILDTNYRKRFGEVDIVARKDDVLAFVEVKLRRHQYFNLSEVITYSKQKKIIRAAKAFILEYKIYDVAYRFDVALITYNNNYPHLSYIPNAFTDTTGF